MTFSSYGISITLQSIRRLHKKSLKTFPLGCIFLMWLSLSHVILRLALHHKPDQNRDIKRQTSTAFARLGKKIT